MWFLDRFITRVNLMDAYASGKFAGSHDLKVFLVQHGITCETHVC